MNLFKSKKKLIEQIKEKDKTINKLILELDRKIMNKLDKIKELEQDKTYYIQMKEEDTQEEINMLRLFVDRLRKEVQWTIPNIYIFNRKLRKKRK